MADVPAKDVAVRPDVTSANEAMIDLLYERAIDLLRLEASTRGKVVALLNDLESEIIAALAKIDPTETPKAVVQRMRLQQLQRQVDFSIQASYRDNDVLLAQEIREVADVEATWTANALNSAMKVDFVDTGVTRILLETLVSDVLIQGAPTSEWWSRQAGGLSERFADEMRRGVAIGEPLNMLIARVRGDANQRGIMDIARSSASALVRSSVQTAANVARESTYERNSDLVKALQWSATLDTRTSIWCITRDGHLYDVKTKEAQDGGPPWLDGPGKLHWNCRSTSIPVLKSWRDLGIDEDEIPQTTRASMDGQVPANQSFEAWLKKQSVARQNDVLGVGKADLWRTGKIDFRDLLDQSGRPLTTEQLRAKEARRSED
jgi:SPP1 gp7 family putative phage head morphogenesis protein